MKKKDIQAINAQDVIALERTRKTLNLPHRVKTKPAIINPDGTQLKYMSVRNLLNVEHRLQRDLRKIERDKENLNPTLYSLKVDYLQKEIAWVQHEVDQRKRTLSKSEQQLVNKTKAEKQQAAIKAAKPNLKRILKQLES